MYRLAHISDPHVGPLPKIRPAELMNKRILGYLSWVNRRRVLHRMEVLEAMADDLRAEAADHCAVTGDLTNISLPGEFKTAAAWLARVGDGARVSVIPGNHDAYIAVERETTLGLWDSYMTSEEAAPAVFPYLRRRGPLAIIGLSSACPTPAGYATGHLGEPQVEALAALLRQAREEGLCRVVLVHHPPHPKGTSPRKRLVDGDRLCATIAAHGAELILHGHDHTFAEGRLTGPEGPAAVFGIPSASASFEGKRPVSHYQLYGITAHDGGWRIEVTAKGYDPANHRFLETKQSVVTLART